MASQTSWRITGSGYGRPAPKADEDLVRVGPGTPCGELMRRYWHPVAISAEVTTRPRLIKILGEELILFRDGKGRPGLLYPRCMHRGTSLFYGKVGEEGIRCCYHGWLFDVEGNCLNQPCEPGGGAYRDKARQPWYPVEERYGLVFAYLGPPEKKPVLPRYDIMEDLEEGEQLHLNIGSFGSTMDNSFAVPPHVPYSWILMADNIMDPMHVQVLHSTFSIVQFVPDFAIMPTLSFYEVEEGLCYAATRELEDGTIVERLSSLIAPNVQSVPSIALEAGRSTMLGWIVPVDDTHYYQVFMVRSRRDGELDPVKLTDKFWGEYSDAEHQDIPQDYEAQASAGPIPGHSEEHLVQSDRGVLMLRRFLKRQMKRVADGEDPAGVRFDPADATVHVRSGNFFRKPSDPSATDTLQQAAATVR